MVIDTVGGEHRQADEVEIVNTSRLHMIVIQTHKTMKPFGEAEI